MTYELPQDEQVISLFFYKLYAENYASSILVLCPASLSKKAKGERESGNFQHISCICARFSLGFETANQIAEHLINISLFAIYTRTSSIINIAISELSS